MFAVVVVGGAPSPHPGGRVQVDAVEPPDGLGGEVRGPVYLLGLDGPGPAGGGGRGVEVLVVGVEVPEPLVVQAPVVVPGGRSQGGRRLVAKPSSPVGGRSLVGLGP